MEIQNRYGINLISFEITNENDEQLFKIYYKDNSPAPIKIQCILFFTTELRNIVKNSNQNYIYLTLLSTETMTPQLLYQQIDFTNDQLSKDGLLKFVFDVSVPFIKNKEVMNLNVIRIRLSYSNQGLENNNLDNLLKSGAFIDTLVPFEVINNAK